MTRKSILIMLVLSIAGIKNICSQDHLKRTQTVYYDSHNELYTGTYIDYYPNGYPEIALSIENGLPNGKAILYYENGKIKEIQYYKNGNKAGLWTGYYENGIKSSEAIFSNNLKQGVWKIWNHEGKLLYTITYQNNRIVKKEQLLDK